MANIAIENNYTNHPFYRNRVDTDTFFALPHGSVAMKGTLDNAIRFIEDYQLLDAPLWKTFVDQFRNTDPKADDADDGWRGEYWGKMMRGACFVYQYTGNKALYDTLAATVRDMMTCADENGRISAYSVAHQYHGWDMWCRKYVLLGMQYFIEICRDESLIKQITASLCSQVDYLIATVGYESEGKVHISKTSAHWHGINSCSILEPIVRLYNLTGEQKYLDFATYIVNNAAVSDDGTNLFELAYRNELPLHKYAVTKAYEVMSCFEGLLEYYRVTKIEKWKTAVINFANRVKAEEISVIGSAGCTHELFDNTLVRQTNTKYSGMLQETCVTVTWMKFCYQLLSLTGDSSFADEIEKSQLNAYLGAVNYNKNSENGGLPFDSYSPLLMNNRGMGIGGHKIMADGSYYGCCACIGSAGMGLIGMNASLLAADGVVINTFTNEKINALTPSGEKLGIKVTTEYPLHGTVNFEITNDTEGECTLYVRIPEWSKKTFASLNGEEIAVQCGTYANFSKVFKKGDYVTLSFDMRAHVINAVGDPDDENSKYHVAIKRGPLMLARDSRLAGDMESPVSFAPDCDGYIDCEIANFAKNVYNYSFNVKNSDNLNIPMIDYASAGRTWNDGSIMSVWLPTRNYWAFDISKEVYITAPNMWEMSAGRYPLAIGDDALLQILDEGSEGDKFLLWSTGEDRYLIRSQKTGMYLALTANGDAVTLSEKGDEFKLTKHAQSRYRIAAPNGLDLISAPGMKAPHITLGAPSCEAIHIFNIEQ